MISTPILQIIISSGDTSGGSGGSNWVLTTGIWDNSKFWDNSAFYRNN